MCLHGSACLITIATRKKCPACRFDKCLNMGMKLEAIRVDRTRGGRSTYPFTYTIPAPSSSTNVQPQHGGGQHSGTAAVNNGCSVVDAGKVKQEERPCRSPAQEIPRPIPQLLQVSIVYKTYKNKNEGRPKFFFFFTTDIYILLLSPFVLTKNFFFFHYLPPYYSIIINNTVEMYV